MMNEHSNAIVDENRIPYKILYGPILKAIRMGFRQMGFRKLRPRFAHVIWTEPSSAHMTMVCRVILTTTPKWFNDGWNAHARAPEEISKFITTHNFILDEWRQYVIILATIT